MIKKTVMAFIAIMLISCTSVPVPSEQEIPSNQNQISEIILWDAIGQEVVLPETPSRIVIAGIQTPMIVNLFYLFYEAKDAIVAIENRSQSINNFLIYVDDTGENKMQIEKGANAEQIAPLKPDLVILKSSMKEQVGDTLHEINIPVFYLGLENIEEIYKDIENIGEILNNSSRAEEIIAFYQERELFIESRMRGIEREKYPSVLLLQCKSAQDEISFEVPPANWLQTNMVEMAGGLPVWTNSTLGSGWTGVNFEQIAAWDADIILFVSYFSDPTEILTILKENSAWQQLKAIENNQIYGFPGDFISWDQPDPRWILALQWLAKTFHPEIFSDLSITDEIITFYEFMYGIPESKTQGEILPMVKGSLY